MVHFFLFHSGGVAVYIKGKHEYDLRNITYLCGKQANISLLIMGKTADIHAWGFRYHSNTEEFRENNGTKFLADFKALPVESFLGIWFFFLDREVTHISMRHILVSKKIKVVLHQSRSQGTLLLEGGKGTEEEIP